MNRKTMNLLINSIDILLVVLTNIMNILLITLLFKKTRQKRIEKIHIEKKMAFFLAILKALFVLV
jgi:hypothetical protein